jgi:formate dehydrogenase iron-sulfur subunit
MDKCTFCAGGPDETLSEIEFKHYGQNRIAEGKIPMCASMCSTKALIAGDASEVDKIYEYRTAKRGENTSLKPYGWEAYNNGK